MDLAEEASKKIQTNLQNFLKFSDNTETIRKTLIAFLKEPSAESAAIVLSLLAKNRDLKNALADQVNKMKIPETFSKETETAYTGFLEHKRSDKAALTRTNNALLLTHRYITCKTLNEDIFREMRRDNFQGSTKFKMEVNSILEFFQRRPKESQSEQLTAMADYRALKDKVSLSFEREHVFIKVKKAFTAVLALNETRIVVLSEAEAKGLPQTFFEGPKAGLPRCSALSKLNVLVNNKYHFYFGKLLLELPAKLLLFCVWLSFYSDLGSAKCAHCGKAMRFSEEEGEFVPPFCRSNDLDALKFHPDCFFESNK